MLINSINFTNSATPKFGARINLDNVAVRLRQPEKVKESVSYLTKNCPNDRLELHLAYDGWLNIAVIDKFNNKRALDLTLDLVDELFKSSEQSITKKLVLSFKTLKLGIERDILMYNEKILTPEMLDYEKYRTRKIMAKMVEKDEILSDAFFID